LTALDWGIVVFTVFMAVWGYAQGLIVGFLSLAGFALGAVVGSRVAPHLLHDGSHSPYAPLVALAGALLVGGVLASGLELLGFRLRGLLGASLGVLDGLGGALLVGALGLAMAWVAGSVALNTPGASGLREPIQRSAVLKRLNATLPPSGPILQALARFDPLPSVTGPSPGVRAPDSAVARDPQVRAAGTSVVKVLGTACGLGVEGSGWVAGNSLVVTNAHVVAGQDDTTVQLRGQGPHLDAQPVYFDAHDDVAVLRVPAVAQVPALPMDEKASAGTSGAILGFPENGPYDVEPARVGRTATSLSQDAYGRGPVQRLITALRGLVRSGNSGGPVVDGRGRVLTTVFAAARRSGSGSGFGVPDSVVRRALGRAGRPVDTGACAH
jgi:S1-C subfamily serine protease